MNYSYLLTGGNMGNREDQLKVAAKLLEERCGKIIDRSGIYETEPWGKMDQEMFLNQVLVVQTRFSAKELLNLILQIETFMGRSRLEKNGPRLIDIDILFYNHQIINAPELVVPHPHMSERRFVLAPLNEVASAYIHPVFFKTVSGLLLECKDPLSVKRITE